VDLWPAQAIDATHKRAWASDEGEEALLGAARSGQRSECQQENRQRAAVSEKRSPRAARLRCAF